MAIVVALGQLALGGAALRAGGLDEAVLAGAKHATLMVRVTDASDAELSGSGVLITDKGVVLTNAHVLGMVDPDSRPPKKIEVVVDSGEPGAQTIEARLMGVDRRADLAALRLAPGKKLPKALTLGGAPPQLRETQEVYLFGFPFGKQLGPNITVAKASVSSLRKENNRVKEIQLSGGVHPGNSGGPAIDEEGKLIGMAVAAISGTTIGFAIPSQMMFEFLIGTLNDYGTDISVREGDVIKILYHLNFIDPMSKVKNVRIEHFQGPAGKPHPPSIKRADPRPDETPVVSVDIPYDGSGSVKGELVVEPLKDPKFVYWFRPVFTNGAGVEIFMPELSGMTSPPVERRPMTVNFKPKAGPAGPFVLTNESSFRMRPVGGKEESNSVVMKAILEPEFRLAKGKNPDQLLLRFAKFSLGIKENGKEQKVDEDVTRIIKNVTLTSAIMDLDTDGVPTRTEVVLGKSEPKYKTLLTQLDEQMLMEIESLAVPIPNGTVQPLQTFRAQRNVAAGMPGLMFGAQADLKFKFQGAHQLKGKGEAAVFDFTGPVRSRRGESGSVGGLMFGRVEVSPETGEILLASTDLKIDMDVKSPGRLLRITGQVKGGLRPATVISESPDGAPGADGKPVASDGKAPPALAADDKRVEWTYKDQGPRKQSGSFKRGDDGVWTEANSSGETHKFKEQERNDKFVILVDAERNIALRLHDDHNSIRRDDRWLKLYQGGWASN